MKPLPPLALLLAALMLPVVAPAQDKATSKKTSAKAAAAPTAAPTPLATADSEQLLAATLVYIGRYDCEYGQILTVSRHNGADGYIDVEVLQRKAVFKPVRSTTGAVRLEEVTTGALLVVQIPSKSILMDTKAGKRLIDGCQADEQKKFASMAKSGENTLGMNAPGQIAVTGTPAAAPAAKN